MEDKFLRTALFGAMTANAYRLGTVLTLGWFWPQVGGCYVLYRGSSTYEIEFENVLAVATLNAREISPPTYVQHSNGTTYFYVVRAVNGCGDEENTLSAAAKVVIDADGDLAKPQPNNILEARVKRTASNRVQFLWFYCPLDQQSPPACFKIYHDGGTGQIDYENPLAVIGYRGRRFYSWESASLESGTHLFCIKAEDSAGAQSSQSSQIEMQFSATCPEAVDILSMEAV
ncbi:MAG: hypothetical protein ACYTBJ_15605 [Planctomycetota bacterium]|jgi:hypothetical protein